MARWSEKIRAAGYALAAASRDAAEGAVIATSCASEFPAIDWA
jgi:hypothetical protein